jgi:MFS family permease
MSILTVMAGAAIAPALGIIKAHFASAPQILVQFIVSIPALFIIITNLFFLEISKYIRTRSIAITGLLLYVISGTGCYFIDNIYVLLLLRALLGISVGLIMPLSTGLLSFYFPPEDQARLMGLSAAMNQMGGAVATLLAGILASIRWNYAFLVYLLGLVTLLMVIRWLPNAQLDSKNKRGKKFEPKQLLKFHPSVIGMLLLMMIFFIFPTNFAITAERITSLSTNSITILMVSVDFIAMIMGIIFDKLMKAFRESLKYFSAIFFMAGYVCIATAKDSLAIIIVGCLLVGIANGVGVPYLNTIASIKGGSNSATTVMPLLSASLYSGQFVSPLIVTPFSYMLFPNNDIVAPYKIGIIICTIFLFQVWSTRHYQSLPPEE